MYVVTKFYSRSERYIGRSLFIITNIIYYGFNNHVAGYPICFTSSWKVENGCSNMSYLNICSTFSKLLEIYLLNKDQYTYGYYYSSVILNILDIQWVYG